MIKKFKRAFTIVELVIVIAVVGILASVLIPTFSNIIKNATVSADTQHVTSMNIQLAASLNDITTEEELKQQIDIVFEGNHFDDFAPQSAKYGYHYWYDIANKKIVLATSSELSATPVNNTESGIGGFGISTYAASTSKEFKGFEFRYFFNRGYYLLDRAGSDVAEALDRLTDLNEEKYLQVVQLLFKAESSGYDMDLATVLKEKVATTAIITDNGTFRFNRNNVNNVLFVEGIETVAAELYVYNEATETIEKGFSSVERPIAHASEINLPASVETVESNAMFFADNSAVINMAQGKDSTEIFDAKSTNATIKNANGQTCEMGSNYTTTVTSFDVELKDGENDKIKVNSNFVYVAYDMGNFYLKATNFNEDASSQEVQYELKEANDFIRVDANGKVTINSAISIEKCSAVIRVIPFARENDDVIEEITVCVIRPNNVQFTIDGQTKYTTTGGSVELKFYGEEAGYDYQITTGTVSYNTPAAAPDKVVKMVKAWTADVKYVEDAGDLFSIDQDTNVLTLEDLDDYTGKTQTFTVNVNNGLITKEITVSVNDLSAEPFAVKAPFKDAQFLYRVGNMNAIKLGTFFENEKPGDVELKIYDYTNKVGIAPPMGSNSDFTAAYEGTDGDTWDVDKEGWETTAIQFSGTGVAKIELGEVSVLVEVVDGKNVTEYSEFILKSGINQVLLSDIAIPTGSYTTKFYLDHMTLFGNGFTFDVSEGHYKNGNEYLSDNYLFSLNYSTLNNVKIIGREFTGFGLTKDKADNICNVLCGNEGTIINCYISNCATPVRFDGTKLTIINSTISGGSMANIDARSGSLVLENVTTINQRSVAGQRASQGAVGFGVVVGYDGTKTNVIIKGELNQYNYLTKTDIEAIDLDLTSDAIADAVFNNTTTADFIYTDNSGTKWVNTGILSTNDEYCDSDDIFFEDFVGIERKSSIVAATYLGVSFKGFLCSIEKDKVELANPTEYVTAGQGAILPTVTVDNTANYQAKTEGDNNYCYVDGEKVLVSFDQGSSKVFNLDGFVKAEKEGKPLSITNVYLDGALVNGATVTFNTTGEHALTFEYEDPNNYDKEGNKVTITYRKSVKVSVTAVKPNAKHASFDFNGMGFETVQVGDKTYVQPKNRTDSSKYGTKTVSGQTIYAVKTAGISAQWDVRNYVIYKTYKWGMFFPVFSGVVTITDYSDGGLGSAITYNASTTTMPAKLAAVNPGETFKYQASVAAPTTPALGKGGASSILCYKTPDNFNQGTTKRGAMTVTAEYSYTDNAGATYYYYVMYDCPQSYGA